MICFEEKLRELVSLMPDLVNDNGTFPIRYDWGTQDVLNKFLLISENVSKYPLIWLVTGQDNENIDSKTVTRTARIVFAVNSFNKDEFNEFQYKNDYKNIIIPVSENFIKMLDMSQNATILNRNFKKQLHPNYSVNDNNKALISVWNALVLDIEIEITDKKCVPKSLKF